MKLKLVRPSSVAGNALLVTCIFIIVLTLSIGGYMTYVMQQARLGSRSQSWNMALAVSEAGIEEGLQHLNADAVADSNNLSADSWNSLGNTEYSVTRALNNGSFPASYTVTINFQNSQQPIITAIAYVTNFAVARKSSPFFYATATANNSGVSSGVGRGVQVTAFKPPFFNAAMVAKGSIDMNGNNVTVDSFDSGIAGKNVNGQWASSVSGDEGIVASLGGITNSSVSIGNANIYGDLYSGVNEQTNIGNNGFVGTHQFAATNGSGFEPGHAFNDANFTFPDTSFPYGAGGGLAPTSNTVSVITGTNFTAFTNANTTSLPSGLTNGQYVGPIVTNASDIITPTYPGPMPGLFTNTTVVTTSSYPGPEPGLGTNYSKNGKTITGYYYNSLQYNYTNTTYSYTVFSTTPAYTNITYADVLSGGNYYSANGLGNTIVTGPSTLVLPNGYSISTLTIAPGGSLTLYVGGTTLSLAGNQVINQEGLAQDLIIYAATTVTSVSFSGNAAFTGVIVAPNATATMNGGGNNEVDYSGALMVNSVTMNGHFNFHYDVALSRVPSPGRYVAHSWTELTNLVQVTF